MELGSIDETGKVLKLQGVSAKTGVVVNKPMPATDMRPATKRLTLMSGWLDESLESNPLVELIYNHDMDSRPFASTLDKSLDLSETTSDTLKWNAVLSDRNRLSPILYEQVKNRSITGCSVGTEMLLTRVEDDMLYVDKADIREVTVTPNPANPLCQAELRLSLENVKRRELLLNYLLDEHKDEFSTFLERLMKQSSSRTDSQTQAAWAFAQKKKLELATIDLEV